MGAVGFRMNIFFDTLVPKRGGNGEPQYSKHEGRPCGGLRRAEWLLVAEQEPPLGSHVVTSRCGYQHHGIYVGDGKVVHYAGLAHGLHRGPVEEISLARFTDGHPVWVRSDATPNFDRREVIRRARSRLGEDSYRLLTNNCEHFCEWCLHGTARSLQVEAWLARPRLTLLATLRLIIRMPTLSLLR